MGLSFTSVPTLRGLRRALGSGAAWVWTSQRTDGPGMAAKAGQTGRVGHLLR
ncbi:MAG TPA: hypothetical protein VII76_15355 [Acidimicrobiales bacterium]